MASDPAPEKALLILAIPESDSWFGERFPKDKVQELVRDQNAALTQLGQGLMNLLNRWPQDTRFQVTCRKNPAVAPRFPPRPDAILPLTDVVVDGYELTYTADTGDALGQGGKGFSQFDNFVYVDGAYRYVGGGAYPFWSTLISTTRPPAAGTPSPAIQSGYDNSSSGLKRLMQDAKSNNDAKLNDLITSMILPDPQPWFSRVFGAEKGQAYARLYTLGEGILSSQIKLFWQEALKQEFTSVDVVRFTNACTNDADENEYPFLLSRQAQETLSRVRFFRPNGFISMEYFTYAAGGFRYLGALQTNPNPRLASDSAATATVGQKPDRVASALLDSHLLKPPQFTYPQEAARENVQGPVSLRVVISVEGVPTEIEVIKGRCVLAEAAIRAVRQSRYSPIVINGTAVEVESDVSVNFTNHP